MKPWYEENILKDQIYKVRNTDRKTLLKKKQKNENDRFLCLITYDRKMQKKQKNINKYWNVLQINPKLREAFQNKPFVVFKRNKSLQEIIGGRMIKNGNVFKTHLENKKGKCEPCNINIP